MVMVMVIVDVLRNLLKKVNMQALLSAAKDLNIELPSSLPPSIHESSTTAGSMLTEDEVLDEIFRSEDSSKLMHHLLFEVHVQNGSLICPESSRRFPIKDGIPNMLLYEDEV
jgi:multifunctional methyltransferase subunit TRM112